MIMTVRRMPLAHVQLLCDWRGRLKACLRDRTDLVLENLALRHQLMVLERG